MDSQAADVKDGQTPVQLSYWQDAEEWTSFLTGGNAWMDFLKGKVDEEKRLPCEAEGSKDPQPGEAEGEEEKKEASEATQASEDASNSGKAGEDQPVKKEDTEPGDDKTGGGGDDGDDQEEEEEDKRKSLVSTRSRKPTHAVFCCSCDKEGKELAWPAGVEPTAGIELLPLGGGGAYLLQYVASEPPFARK